MPKTKNPLKELRELKAGNEENLGFDWPRLQQLHERKNGGGLQLHARTMIIHLRTRGILRYLVDADRQSLFEACYQAGLMYEYINALISAGMPHDPRLYSGAAKRGLFDAILTFAPAEFKRLLATAPAEQQRGDDPIAFLFHVFLMEIADGQREDYEETLRVLREEAAKLDEDESADIEIAICESLRGRNPAEFLEAMQAYLARQQAAIEEHEDIMVGEEYLSIEGLALRRLASRLGIDVQIRHPLTPLDLQENYAEALSPGEVPAVPAGVAQPGFWEGWPPPKPW
jgi:hypothetical protein